MAERISGYNPEAGKNWRTTRNYFLAGGAILLFFAPSFAALSAVGAFASHELSNRAKKE